MGLIIAALIGGAIGAASRRRWARQLPSRADVACLLAAVGALLGVLAGAIAGAPWASRVSPGTAIAAIAGAGGILLAFAVLPRATPALTKGLPGRPTP